LAGSRELLLDPVGGQQSTIVVLEFIGGEQREVSIGASLDASHYLVGRRTSVGISGLSVSELLEVE
jgi:hypothetical protein